MELLEYLVSLQGGIVAALSIISSWHVACFYKHCASMWEREARKGCRYTETNASTCAAGTSFWRIARHADVGRR